MTAILVLGAGGHAKVVADIARLCGHTVTAYVDERGTSAGSSIGGVPVISRVEERPSAAVALGIGDNRARSSRHEDLTRRGRDVLTLVHPAAVLASEVRVGAGTVVMAGVVVNSDAVIGAAAVLNTSSSVDHDCTIGDGVHIAPGSHLAGNVTVGAGALIGVGCVIIPGRHIGAWSLCGAGSVIVHDVPAATTVRGSPAR